jgi:hypothetical protein
MWHFGDHWFHLRTAASPILPWARDNILISVFYTYFQTTPINPSRISRFCNGTYTLKSSNINIIPVLYFIWDYNEIVKMWECVICINLYLDFRKIPHICNLVSNDELIFYRSMFYYTCIREQNRTAKKNLDGMISQIFMYCQQLSQRSSYQEGKVGIPWIVLSPLHVCVCPKPVEGFPTSYYYCCTWCFYLVCVKWVS